MEHDNNNSEILKIGETFKSQFDNIQKLVKGLEEEAAPELQSRESTPPITQQRSTNNKCHLRDPRDKGDLPLPEFARLFIRDQSHKKGDNHQGQQEQDHDSSSSAPVHNHPDHNGDNDDDNNHQQQKTPAPTSVHTIGDNNQQHASQPQPILNNNHKTGFRAKKDRMIPGGTKVTMRDGKIIVADDE